MANPAARTWRCVAANLGKLKSNRTSSTITNPSLLQMQVTSKSVANRQGHVFDQQRFFCSGHSDAAKLLCRSVEDVRMIKEQLFSRLEEDIAKTRAQLSRGEEAWMIQEQLAHLWQQYSYISELVSKIETGVLPRLAKEAGRIDEQHSAKLAEDAIGVRQELQSRFDHELARIADQLWSRPNDCDWMVDTER